MIIVLSLLLTCSTWSIEILLVFFEYSANYITWVSAFWISIYLTELLLCACSLTILTECPTFDTSCYPSCWWFTIPRYTCVLYIDLTHTILGIVLLNTTFTWFLCYHNRFMCGFESVSLRHLGSYHPHDLIFDIKSCVLYIHCHPMI